MITYFHRNKSCGYSIQKVFRTIENEIQRIEKIKVFYVPSIHSKPWDSIRNWVYIFKHRDKNQIHHISGHIYDAIIALKGYKNILTIHDLVFIDNTNNPISRFYKWLFWLYIPIKLADKVTCISEETKRRVLQYVKTDKIQVIHNPIDPSFVYSPKVFNENKPVVLHVGTYWNKNLERTIIALKGIPCHLRIIGEVKPKTMDLLKESGLEYSVKSDLTDDEIRQEYIHCDIVNFPSIYEGFGMPIIEGQQTGRVVITSLLEPMIEVSGGAVEYVDPYNTDSIRNAYLHIIQDASFREELIQKGLENVKRFDAKKIAGQYLNLYNELRK